MATSPLTNEYRLRLGRVVIGLQGLSPELAADLADWFAQPSDPAAADLSIRLTIRDDGTNPPVPNSLILTKRTRGSRFEISDGLVRGTFDAATGTGEIEVHAVLTRGRLRRVFEQILYQAFHSARRRAAYDAGLLHSCAVIHAGAGYLFAGPAGSGKTTVARLSTDHHVLSDEMPIVEFRDGTPWTVGTPFNGLFREKSPGAAPLRGILLLTHGPTHVLAKAGPGEAAAALAAEVAPPVGLDQVADGGTTAAMLEFATRLALTVPVRRLIFRPDPGFWPIIHDGLPANREETP
jgi:hypothetical protein